MGQRHQHKKMELFHGRYIKFNKRAKPPIFVYFLVIWQLQHFCFCSQALWTQLQNPASSMKANDPLPHRLTPGKGQRKMCYDSQTIINKAIKKTSTGACNVCTWCQCAKGKELINKLERHHLDGGRGQALGRQLLTKATDRVQWGGNHARALRRLSRTSL